MVPIEKLSGVAWKYLWIGPDETETVASCALLCRDDTAKTKGGEKKRRKVVRHTE